MRRAAPWILAAPWIVWALWRTLGVDRAVPFTAAIVAFTPYAALTAAVPLLVALVLRRWRAALATLAALVLLAMAVQSRAFGGPATVPPGTPSFTVVTSNLYLGRGDTADVVRLARRSDADVVVLLEIDDAALDRARAAGLRDAYPHAHTEPRPGGTGSAILSRAPIERAYATTDRAYSQPAADIRLAGGGTVRVQAVHPPPPVGRDQARAWRQTLRALPVGGRPRGPSVLAGDFNATLDHHELRRLLDTGYTDAADALGEGLQPTWPVGRAALPITIDHVLGSEELRPQAYDAIEITRSDHRAVVARFAVR